MVRVQVYGKGVAKDCRKHVQKLNMLRGEKEREESTGKQHPPQDYADTFTSRDSSSQPELLNPVNTQFILQYLLTFPSFYYLVGGAPCSACQY